MPCENSSTSCHAVNVSPVSPGLEQFSDLGLNVTADISTAFSSTPATPNITSPFTLLHSTSLLTLFNITTATSTVVNASSPTSTPGNGTALREDPVRLDVREVVVTLCLSLLAILANLLVLFLTKFAGGGQSPTMVFVRVLCMSDFFLGCYGLGKMVMFFFVDDLIINFFLPESLFFTATTASCLSLLLLNLDRCVKMAWPLWYLQNVDKPSIITGMVFLWNVSFVLGFLPLLGWNSQGRVFLYSFFRFFPWPYLLLTGAVWVLCTAGSLAVLLWVRGRYDLTLPDGQHLSLHLTEVEKYCKLRGTVLLDLATWALCYLPYLAFLGLACDACPLGGRTGVRVGVYHFVPVFMLRALGGAGLQLYRTVRVQGLVTRRSTGHHHHHLHHHHHIAGASRTNGCPRRTACLPSRTATRCVRPASRS
ncbi:cannabinoid receptor 2-like [Babylonia areolata]|uniref:cannabinoid receptor 2-like n=1 Tax=Babylonia areolata TaxID=304850 RepID=UPI003FD1ABFA